MRRAFIAVALAAAAALLPVSAVAAAPRSECGPASARTVKRSALLRVFVVKPRPSIARYRACVRDGSRPVTIAEADSTPRGIDDSREKLERIVLRGIYATTLLTECAAERVCSFELSLTDVRRRRAVGTTEFLSGRADTIVATASGATAFLAFDADTGDNVVNKLDDFGMSERDRGAEVRDLRLGRNRVISWHNGPRERSEPIAHVRRCGPRADTTLLGRSARVYTVQPAPGGDEFYACLLRGGRPLFLGEDLSGSSAYGYLGDFQIISGHVVWHDYDCFTGSGCNSRIHSADLRRRSIRTGDYHAPGYIQANGRGFAAEIVNPRDDPAGRALYAFDSAGERLLDTGAEIDPASVRIDAGTITWRHGDEQRTEPLG